MQKVVEKMNKGGRTGKRYALYLDGEHLGSGTIKELTIIAGVSEAVLRYHLKNSGKKGLIAVENIGGGDFAYYKGDELLAIGTAAELAEKFGVREDSIRHYSTPTYRKRQKNNVKHYNLLLLD